MQRLVSFSWFRAFMQPVTYLGIVMLLCLYGTLSYLLIEGKKEAEIAAIRNNENLVALFERTIHHSLKSVDEKLELIRTLYETDPSHLDLSIWAKTLEQRGNLTFQFTIVGSDGYVKLTSADWTHGQVFVGDRAPFTVHLTSNKDELFVSTPTNLRSSNKQGLVLTRRISGPDGSFHGVVAATIDIEQLNQLYRDINLGSGGFASLWGLDRVIRVAGANGQLRGDVIGKHFPNAGLFQYLKNSPNGTYWNEQGSEDHVRKINGIKRLVSYRTIDGFPLVAAIGNSEAAIFQTVNGNASIYWMITLVITVGILVAIGFGVRREWKLSATRATLQTTKAWLESAVAHMPHGLCMFDSQNRLIISNRRYATMYGLVPETVTHGTPYDTIMKGRTAGAAPDAARQYSEKALQLLSSREAAQIETPLPDGRVFLVSHEPMADGGAVAIHQDITEQKRAENQIWDLAHCDGLTGLANRLAFQEALDNACRNWQQNRTRFAVHLLDLDNFKDINDSLGHPTGDRLLCDVAQRLRSFIVGGVTVTRLGGDEFGLLQELSSADGLEAIAMATRLTHVIGEIFEIDGQQLLVEASVGVALAPEHGVSADELMKRADLALYNAKSGGRNGYRVFEPDMELAAKCRHDMLTEIRRGIEQEEFELHYQPIFTASKLDIIGFEALIRWRHPSRGMLAPGAFIGIAEQAGLIKPLGNWALRRACVDAMQWPRETTVSVNLSSVQFRKNNLVEVVTAALAESGLSPARLKLEITETVLLEQTEDNLRILRQLQHLGVSIVLDDFGTGYSSLSYLQQFSFDEIKIDRSFVNDLERRSDCMAIVSAITGMARTLDVTTTAEGVENEEQLALLRSAGCDQVQGYLLGRPRPLSELVFHAAPSRSEAA